ncbi:MAG: tRNA-(ms[2]io[6]A)-hydroxylase [Pseudomonadales bacterium]
MTIATAQEILRFATPADWLEAVLTDFDTFLCDHASAEKKASQMAITMISHYPDRTELVNVMSDLAVEELSHFREVIKWIHERGSQLASDRKDAYVIALRKAIRNGTDEYFMDRLLVAGIIEARGAERFGIVAEGLPAGRMQEFYQAITNSEKRHYHSFVDLTYLYLDKTAVDQRMHELLDIEAEICSKLPFQAALH